MSKPNLSRRALPTSPQAGYFPQSQRLWTLWATPPIT